MHIFLEDQLAIILVAAGTVFVILEEWQYSYMADIFDILTADVPLSIEKAEVQMQFFGERHKSFFLGIIPAVLLIARAYW